MQLHKLLYYVQAYHLVWEGCPAFGEDIEAWDMGPVVADLWRDEKRGAGVRRSGRGLPESVRNTVTNVLHRYGHMTGKALSDATHAEDPWRCTGYNQVISHELLVDYFSRETSEVQRMKRALDQVRNDAPFVPDPAEALETLMSEYAPS